MIKNIVKRDGSTQPFDPSKVNGWGEWAAKHLGGVDWGSIVLNATAKLPETVSSETLQLALIDECHAMRTWKYSRMAGRLYAALQRKRIYRDQIPSIKDLHVTMANVGLLHDEFVQQWSDDDYQKIDAMLQHKRDFGYAYYQLQQFNDKYALQDRTAGIVYETPQFVYMRVAMALSTEEHGHVRLKMVERFYNAFSQNKINIPTPYFVNAGTTNSGFISCCLYETDDNAGSLAAGDHIAYMMTVASAGIGAAIHTRSIGKPVRGGLISHQGKLAYYRALAGAIGANLQNGRGGAATVTYTVYDPEIETIQKLKNPMTPPAKGIRTLDYSMAYNNFFVRKAAKGEKYHTFDYNECKPLYDALYSDEAEFERLYDLYVAEGKYEEELDARTILLSALTEAIETGRHYLLNLTEMNRHTSFIDPIKMSNLCLEGSTEITVYDTETKGTSVVTLENFNNMFVPRKFKVLSAENNGNTAFFDVTASAITGYAKELIEIESDGHIVRCTPEHKIMTKNRGWVEAQHLKEDDVLVHV